MEKKFTDGPWNYNNNLYLSDGIIEIFHDRDENGLNPIADVKIGDRLLPENLANAQLIAAAPDLLEACQYVVDYHREHDSGEGELCGLDFVTTCIAAIRKSTGGK